MSRRSIAGETSPQIRTRARSNSVSQTLPDNKLVSWLVGVASEGSATTLTGSSAGTPASGFEAVFRQS
jgi:hypothetical protein